MALRRLLLALFLASTTLICGAQTFTNEFVRLRDLPDTDTAIANIALADYNADGRLDMYHVGRLYKQAEDGTFQNTLVQADINLEGNTVQGGIFGDANKDGLLDLLIMDVLPGSRFYLNLTGERFNLANSSSRITFQGGVNGAFWNDVNGDGWLDLVASTPNGSNPVFIGSASDEHTNVAALMLSQTTPSTCGLALADYDRDGDTDFFGATCTGPNSLMTNNSASDRFRNTASSFTGISGTRNSRAGIWFDYDNDGWEDLLVINEKADLISSLNNLYHNDFGTFTDVAVEAGVAGNKALSNGPGVVADFDNDGWQDIYLPIGERGRFYHNNGDGTFDERWDETVALDSTTAAVATGDLNNDGWMDLVIPHQLGTAIMINDGGSNNWVTFELRDDLRNRFGVGATLRLTSNGMEQMRVISAGTGSGSQNDFLRAHFGIGSATIVDQLVIEWPGGPTETFQNLTTNTNHVIVKTLGLNEPPKLFSQSFPPDAGFVDTSVEILRLEWEVSEDIESILYTVSLTGPGLRLSFPGLNNSFLDLETVFLPKNQVYTWSVTATDGHSVRGSGQQHSFSFGEPDVASSTLAEPALFNFGIPPMSSGFAEFADFDVDGDLDLFVAGDDRGRARVQLYRADDASVVLSNNGGEFIFKTLTQVPSALALVSEPTASWGDVDLDGDPDLIVTGLAPGGEEPLSAIYLNNVGTFVPVNDPGVPHVWGGSVQFGDVDGDGDQDLLISGSVSAHAPFEPITRVLLNRGNLTFVDSDAGLPGVMFGDASWADFDADGDLDVVLTGDLGGGNLHAGFYINNGGVFSLMASFLPALIGGSVTFGDVDGDSDPDLMITGGRMSPNLLDGVSALFINNGGSFTRDPFPFAGVVTGTAIWGDYENDGDQDIFVIGVRTPLGEPVGRLYRNVNGQFAPELDVKGFVHATAAFGDYNQDGDMDLIAFGIDAEGLQSVTFYINQQIPEPVPTTR